MKLITQLLTQSSLSSLYCISYHRLFILYFIHPKMLLHTKGHMCNQKYIVTVLSLLHASETLCKDRNSPAAPVALVHLGAHSAPKAPIQIRVNVQTHIILLSAENFTVSFTMINFILVVNMNNL